MDDDLSSRLAQAKLAGTQPITRDVLLRRLRSEATTWINAVRMQRRRVVPIEDGDLWEIEIDLHFLLVALVRLERAVARAASEDAAIDQQLREALDDFRSALPGLRVMRDVAEHADEYNLSRGQRHPVGRSEVQVWSMSLTTARGVVWSWLGHELDVDAAEAAAAALYHALDATLTPILGDSHRTDRAS